MSKRWPIQPREEEEQPAFEAKASTIARRADEEIASGDAPWDDEEDDFEDDELDPFFPGDEWLEPDIEWEMTAESEEGYGDD